MRHILFLLFMAFALQAIAQYPATGNKARLGWQTTGDGLVYRGAIGDTATLDPSGLNNAWMLLDTANGNLYAYRAKAWRLVSGGGGSVSDTLTGEVKGPLDSTYIDTVANIIFTTTTDTTVGVGELEYNDTQGSLIQGLKGGNVTNVIGQQIHQRVTNATGAPLTKGTAVFLYGSQGNRITVRKALATADSTSANTFGIVAESIADNQSGYVITEGLITNINTNALTEGAAVYLSPTVAGELTTTKPQAPQHTVYIGVCVKQNAGSGELFVKIRNGQELDELHDVRIDSLASNASLYYNAAQGVWRDTGAAVLVADTSAMLSPYLKKADTLSLSNRINTKLNISDTSVFARDFQISGTTNRLAMFTGANTVGNSVVDVTSDTVSIRDYSNSYTTWRFHSNINKRGFIGYPSGTRFYSLVNPSVYAGFMYGDRSAGAQDQQAFTQLTAWNGGGAAGGFFSAATTLNGADSTLYFNISGLSANANPTFPAAQMVIQKGGNVGIGTSSPSRPLHVAGTAAIRIPVGNLAERGISGAGDIRVRTDTASMEYYSGAWRTVAPMARVPQSGLANRFSKFDANGLLDTSAILIQANNRIGIGNSPAVGDSALTVTGGIRATRDMYARQYNVSTFTGQVLSINNYAPAGSPLGQNIFIGTTGLSNVYQGFILDGSFNTSVGVSALNANTTGYGNTALGRNTLSKNTKGSQNTAVGLSSLTENTLGDLNTGVGGSTLGSNTTGNSNTAVGASSLSKMISGSSNTGVGQSTITNNTTGSNNTAVGLNALDNLTTTSNNTAVGYLAGSYAGSGTTANQTSSNSTYIGYQARAGASGNTAEVVIGSDAVGNGSNTVTIGGSTTTGIYFQYGETYIGMAVDSGAYTLQVNGNTKLIGNLARKKPVTIAAATYTVLSDDSWLICNHTAQITITLPTAANSIGRELMIKYVAGGGATVISNATNVSPIVGGALTNIILPATAGSWVTLVCDGANWIIMQKG